LTLAGSTCLGTTTGDGRRLERHGGGDRARCCQPGEKHPTQSTPTGQGTLGPSGRGRNADPFKARPSAFAAFRSPTRAPPRSQCQQNNAPPKHTDTFQPSFSPSTPRQEQTFSLGAPADRVLNLTGRERQARPSRLQARFVRAGACPAPDSSCRATDAARQKKHPARLLSKWTVTAGTPTPPAAAPSSPKVDAPRRTPRLVGRGWSSHPGKHPTPSRGPRRARGLQGTAIRREGSMPLRDPRRCSEPLQRGPGRRAPST